MTKEGKKGESRAGMLLDRRGFLVLGSGACLAATWSLVGCEEETEMDLSEGEFAAGNIEDYEVGSVTLFDEGPFFVLRDDAGFWAMTAVCTHQQCTVNPGTDSLPCPCHGSAFDLDGEVVSGPAGQPLANLKVIIDNDGAVSVDTGETVPVGTRIQG